MSLWSDLRVSWQAHKTRRKLNRQFRKREDPFSYASDPYETGRLAAMEAALGGEGLGRVLEAGCAEGHFTERLARRASSVTALDISAVALARARRRAPGATFIEGDLLTWAPGAAERFDVVVVAEFEALFPRIAGWLKPGGRLLMSHAFAGDAELVHRRSFRARFESAGLRLVFETISDADRGGVRCLLSTLEKI